jgi:hypothetical protein
MMNSPLLYSDKKYKAMQTTSKKGKIKNQKLTSGGNSASKKQSVPVK